MKVNANQLRTGNVVEVGGKLYAILKADNIQPGKGTPVTQVEMRRLSDGVKVTERYRTQEQVERAFIDEGDFQYLYDEGDSFAFMNSETYEQLSVAKDIVGEQAVFLQDGMICSIRTHEGVPVSIELPARVTLEVTETEPVIKGQTVSSSFKPAVLDNGARTMVPPHIGVGTRVVISTANGSYVERAKD
ncbi:MAG: elongation factor P [Rhodospirillales bacterium]|nr:elongation factor P [Rhodospirillales bacterium]